MFNVGDKVRVIKSLQAPTHIGFVGIVGAIDTAPGIETAMVKYSTVQPNWSNSSEWTWWYYITDLELYDGLHCECDKCK